MALSSPQWLSIVGAYSTGERRLKYRHLSLKYRRLFPKALASRLHVFRFTSYPRGESLGDEAVISGWGPPDTTASSLVINYSRL